MKNLLYILLVLPLVVLGQNPSQNFVKKKVYKKPSTGILTPADTIVTVTYLDGLGRTNQTVAVKAGGNGEDVITPYVYDNFTGRQVKQYLPYADAAQTASSPNIRDNSSLINTIGSYYQAKYPGELSATVPNPYAAIELEASPLGRIKQQAAPGSNWSLDNGMHTIKYKYDTNTNTDQVFDFNVAFTNNDPSLPELQTAGYYSEFQLYKTVTIDENWVEADGNNKTVQEFKDKQGRLILKRTFNEGQRHDTYYVYDKYSNLTFVIPPKAADDIADYIEPQDAVPYYLIDQAILNTLCYKYKYDHRNRIIEKQIPGKNAEYYVYDKLDRLVMSQDAMLRASRKWLFYKYDIMNRLAYMGQYSYTPQDEAENTPEAIRGKVNMDLVATEAKTTTAFASGEGQIHYTNSKFPQTGITVLNVNYFDNYAFDTDGIDVTLANNMYQIIFTTTPKTLATGSKVRVLDTDKWITSVARYSKRGELAMLRNSNRYFSANNTATANLLEFKPDFAGAITESRVGQVRSGYSNSNLRNYYAYDHAGRETRNTAKVNTGAVQLMSWIKYDEAGIPIQKKVGGAYTDDTVGYGSVNALQTIDFDYNIRGWLTGVNNTDNLGNDLFAYEIGYNSATNGATPLYNGNISRVTWKSATDNNKRNYNYTYDDLNRIKTAAFTNLDNSAQNGSFNLHDIQYDKNGNIKFLNRAGDKMNNPSLQFIDNMTYSYDGNKLMHVKEEGINNAGFTTPIPTTDTSVQYNYDSNGNMISDRNKDITYIQYNYLNLPIKIQFSSGKIIEYVYDALGNKMVKKYTSGNSVTITEYIDGYVYQRMDGGTNRLQYFKTSEGYVSVSSTVPAHTYVFQYKDHLGNVRLSYTDSNGDGAVTASEIIEENNYDPLGLKHLGYNNVFTGSGNSVARLLRYNDKEWQEENNVNWFDYGARNYDPGLGRWMNIDPLAEKYVQFSPYIYAANNPVYFIDPDGKDIFPFIPGLLDILEGIAYTIQLEEVVVQGQRSTRSTPAAPGYINMSMGGFSGFGGGEVGILGGGGGGGISTTEFGIEEYDYANKFIVSPVNTVAGFFEAGGRRAISEAVLTVKETATVNNMLKATTTITYVANGVQVASDLYKLYQGNFEDGEDWARLGVHVGVMIVEGVVNSFVPGLGTVISLGYNVAEEHWGWFED